MVASTPSAPVNNTLNVTDISSVHTGLYSIAYNYSTPTATLHTNDIAPEVHVDPTVTSLSVSVGTVHTSQKLNACCVLHTIFFVCTCKLFAFCMCTRLIHADTRIMSLYVTGTNLF